MTQLTEWLAVRFNGPLTPMCWGLTLKHTRGLHGERSKAVGLDGWPEVECPAPPTRSNSGWRDVTFGTIIHASKPIVDRFSRECQKPKIVAVANYSH